MKFFLLAFFAMSNANAADQLRFLPTENTVSCEGEDCEYYDQILSEQTVTFERDSPDSGHGFWKLEKEGHFYQVDFYYTELSKSRHFQVVAHAGSSQDVRKMATGEASFGADGVPDEIRVSTPFFEADGKESSFGISLQVLGLPVGDGK